MNAIQCAITTLSVVLIFFIWRNYARFLWRKNPVLRQRVAYMLWTMAQKTAETE
jgi:hypothetical protein